MASSSTTNDTQPFSDVSQPGANLEQLVSVLRQTKQPMPSQSDLSLVRIFARCYSQTRYVSMLTYPDNTPATLLDHDVLAVCQSTRSTGCDIQMPAMDIQSAQTHLRLYYDPNQDDVTAQNVSLYAILTLRGGKHPTTLQRLTPQQCISIQPGLWTIISSAVAGAPDSSTPLLDLDIRPRRLWESSQPERQIGSKRRQEAAASSSKKHVAATGCRDVQTSVVTHPLLALNDGETVRMTGPDRNDNYEITRLKNLTSTKHASLYVANYSLRPGQVVVVKAHKQGRGVKEQADNWYREVSVHEKIGQHSNIARLYASDARVLTLYIEKLDAPSLNSYRDALNMCTCPNAAFTILSDVAGALAFIHAMKLVHNDIKPANIIYHNLRGAILIDFGLGGSATKTLHGGSPWYLPPEYLARKSRGPPSDIFAVGVTMLWIMQKCSLPDTKDNWQINNIHQGPFEARWQAEQAMRSWLSQVDAMRSKLTKFSGGLEQLVRGMLRAEGRDTAENIVRSIKSGKF